MEEEDPDSVMLNPEYARKLREADEDEKDFLDTSLGRPLTKEELEAFAVSRKSHKKGLTVRPMFTVRQMGRKNKKPVLVPFIGIQGTF